MIAIDRDDAVATITVDDCTALTRHDLAVGSALRDAVRDNANDDTVKAIVIRATGADFCAPAAPADLAAAARRQINPLRPDWHAAYAAPTGLYQSLVYCRKVVITAVQGRCAGAGSMLVLCSDFTLATPESRFESPFGALPEANLVLTMLTMRLNRAKYWLLGDALDAAAAREAGLINAILPRSQLDAEALRLARAAARMPRDGLAMSKIQVETCLDAQGVGRDFDMAGFNALALARHWDTVAAESKP